MFETFSTNAIQIIDDALQIARSLNKKLVGSEHLLLAMYKKKDTICHFLLDEKQITYDDILRVIHNLVIFRKSDSQSLTYTKKFQEIILYSETLAKDSSLCASSDSWELPSKESVSSVKNPSSSAA